MINKTKPYSIIGVDLGEKGAGIAYSPDQKLVFYFTALHFQTEAELITKLTEKVAEKNAKLVVFGLPLDKDQQTTKQSAWVKKVAKEFSKKSKLKIAFIDEYLTTWQAKQGAGQEFDKDQIDQEAAKIILEDYLETGI